MPVISIRPSRLFAKVEEEGLSRVVQVRIPKRRDPDTPDYSLLLLETYVLVALLKLTDARRVFEFGTFLGATALNLALNMPDDGLVLTIDLGQDDYEKVDTPRQLDHVPMDFRRAHPVMEWDAFPRDVQRKIVPLFGDSTKYGLSDLYGTIDLVWLDGGRAPATIRSDCRNAMRMLRQDKLSVVGWHDYLNPDAPELSEFLCELSLQVPLIHVADTSMVLYFNRPVFEDR